jgi:hypothetical protein
MFPRPLHGHSLTLVTNQAGQPAEVEPYTIADLAADAADVRRALHLNARALQLPDQHNIVLPDGQIPDGALALVAGLDTYGD